MRILAVLAILAGLGWPGWAQISAARPVRYVTTDPSGACGNGFLYYNYTTGNFWGCLNGTWAEVSGGGVLPPPSPGYPANQILSGCGVEYTTGLSFTVGACTYTINGQTYTSPLVNLTLGTADPTNPRIDAIIVNTSSVALILPGTAASSPSQPTIDPATQLQLTFILVAANASTPSNVTTTSLYAENTEWTCTASANFNCASTSNPYAGTKDIEATSAVLTNNVTLVKPAAGTVDLGSYNSLVFYLRSKATWPTGNGANAARSLSVFWLNGSTQKGVNVIVRDGTFGFSSSTTGAYQQVSIPTGLFGAAGLPVTTLEFLIAGNGGSTSIGFYIDQVTLQTGTGTPASSANQNVRTIGAGFGSFQSGATALSTAVTACAPTYIAGTIQAIEIISDVTGTATIDIKKVAHASWTGTSSATTILPGTISYSGTSYTDTTLTGVTAGIAAGTDFCFVVTSPATLAGLAISLKVTAAQ